MEKAQLEQIEKLYMELYPTLYRYAYSCMKSVELAEDVVQETFRIACGKPDALLSCGDPQGWLVLTARNVCRNWCRQREADRELLESHLPAHNAKSGETEKLALLYGPLTKTKEFRLLYAIAVEGKSIREIATEQRVSLTVCYKRIQRAREYLKKELKK